jgi:hypothetical protein
VAALVVAVIAGPWTWVFRNTGRGGWEEASPSVHFTRTATPFYGWEMCVALGWLLTLLALAGAGSLFLRKGRRPAIAVCSLALALGVWMFQCVMPVGHEARHLMPAMPALIVLAMTGLRAVTHRWCARCRPAIAGGLLALFFGWPSIFHPAAPPPGYGSIGKEAALSPFRIPRKEWSGFEPVAEAAIEGGPREPILVASDSRGEGMFIADVAALDAHRPSYTIERASKILASSTWSGSGYQSLYRTPEEVRAALAKAGIALVVTDDSVPELRAHEVLLMEAVNGGGFAQMEDADAVRDGAESPGAIELHSAPGR